MCHTEVISEGTMRNWIQLVSDVNWQDYHGMWAKKAKDGSWYVLRWTNLVDAGGAEFADTPYECAVKVIDLADISQETLSVAINSCGIHLTDLDPKLHELVKIEACIQYGLGAPLETFTGNKHPLRIRAQARKYAEQCMADAELLNDRLNRPVNALGTSAKNYGNGKILAWD